MAFKIIERLQTIVALITRFTQCRTKATDLGCIFGAASRTFFWDIKMVVICSFFRWGNSVSTKFFSGFVRYPIGCPDWRNFGNDFCFDSLFCENFYDIFFNIEHGGTRRICWCNRNFSFVFGHHFSLANNTEFHNINHGNFRVGNLF